jgi:hypothetical protein
MPECTSKRFERFSVDHEHCIRHLDNLRDLARVTFESLLPHGPIDGLDRDA